MNFRKLVQYISMAIMATACSNNMDEFTLQVQDSNPFPVLDADCMETGLPLRLSLYKSAELYGRADGGQDSYLRANSINDAQIQLWLNGEMIESMTNSDRGELGYYTFDHKVTTGNYRVDVHAPTEGYSFGSSCTVPTAVPLDSVSYSYFTYQADSCVALKLHFSDPLERHNYYKVSLEVRRKQYGYKARPGNNFAFYNLDYFLEDLEVVGLDDLMGSLMDEDGKERFFHFDDERISGEPYTYRCAAPMVAGQGNGRVKLMSEGDSLLVFLHSMAEEQYLYIRSWDDYQKAINNEMPATQLYTNITNGKGLFAGSSKSMVALRLE